MENREPRCALNSLYLYLTDRCNLRCSHCWITPQYSQQPHNGIPLASLRKAVTESKQLGLQNVKLTGGEPFLYRHLSEFIEFLAEEQVSVLIETNGTLITRDMVERLKSCDIDQISVSLDAATEGLHDQIRGVKGSFNRTLDGLKLLSEHAFGFQIIMTLQSRNREEIPGVIRLSERLGAGSLKINPLVPCGRGMKAFEHKHNLDVKDLIRLYRMVEERSTSHKSLEIIFDLPIAFRSISDIKKRGISECHILNILGILGNGDYSICGIGQTIEDLRMGNIRQVSIRDVWEKSPILKDLRRSLPWKLSGICGRCIFKFQCLGSCRANAYALSGDFYASYFLCKELFESGGFPTSRYV